MAEKKRTWHWNRAYTHQQLIRESRWLLIFLGIIHAGRGIFLFFSFGGGEEQLLNTFSFVVIGVVYFLAGLIPSFWFRFVCVSIWVVDLVYTNLVLHAPRPASFVFMLIGAIFIYKMLKYRGTTDEPQSSAAGS